MTPFCLRLYYINGICEIFFEFIRHVYEIFSSDLPIINICTTIKEKNQKIICINFA